MIQQSGNAAVTVEMLADMSGQRKDVFSRNFTKDMGITPKDFISAALDQKSGGNAFGPGHLGNSSCPARLIFSSEYYFSHFFKQHIGMSPKIFQQHNGVR